MKGTLLAIKSTFIKKGSNFLIGLKILHEINPSQKWPNFPEITVENRQLERGLECV